MKILVTGASRGIGFETALQLTNKGHKVLALARNNNKLEALKEEAGGKLEILAFDLAEQNQGLIKEAVSQLGGLDILVNNAGLLIKKDFLELTADDWRRSFQINFFAVLDLVYNCIPYLEKSNRAHIVNIGTMGAFQGSKKFKGLAAYSTAKAALTNLTESLAEELSNKKIAVNCLALGAVQTEMLKTAFPDYQAPVNSQQMGAFIAYFCTQGQGLFNGKVIPVNLSNP